MASTEHRRATIDRQPELTINQYANALDRRHRTADRKQTRDEPLQLSNTRARAKQVTYADRIRDQLPAHGVILEDSPTGVRWRPSTR